MKMEKGSNIGKNVALWTQKELGKQDLGRKKGSIASKTVPEETREAIGKQEDEWRREAL